ncbi:hypothetical protein D9M69_631000 [compost metagenome]
MHPPMASDDQILGSHEVSYQLKLTRDSVRETAGHLRSCQGNCVVQHIFIDSCRARSFAQIAQCRLKAPKSSDAYGLRHDWAPIVQIHQRGFCKVKKRLWKAWLTQATT